MMFLPKPITDELKKNIYDGITLADISTALVMSSRVLIEKEPNYTYVTARLLLDNSKNRSSKFYLWREFISNIRSDERCI